MTSAHTWQLALCASLVCIACTTSTVPKSAESSDAEVDATMDAGVIDADVRDSRVIDAHVDARVIDADLIDAHADVRVIDADLIDADTIDAAVTFPFNSGLVAAATPACEINTGGGAFDTMDLDPAPGCVEQTDITAIVGASVLAFSADGVQTMAQNESDIFWTISDDVYRVSKAGDAPLRFVTAFHDGVSLAADACNLYLAGGFFGSMLGSRSLVSGAPWALAQFPEGITASNIVIDDDALYLWSGDALQRIPRSGGAILTMASRHADGFVNPQILAASDTELYWIDGDSNQASGIENIMTMPKGGQTPPRVLAPQLAAPLQILFRNGYVYVLNLGNRDALGNYIDGGAILRIDANTGAQHVMAEVDAGIGITSDAHHLYWTRSPAPGRYTVYRTRLDASDQPSELFSNLHGSGQGLMVDDTHLYWKAECWSDTFSSSFIVRVPKPVALP